MRLHMISLSARHRTRQRVREPIRVLAANTLMFASSKPWSRSADLYAGTRLADRSEAAQRIHRVARAAKLKQHRTARVGLPLTYGAEVA